MRPNTPARALIAPRSKPQRVLVRLARAAVEDQQLRSTRCVACAAPAPTCAHRVRWARRGNMPAAAYLGWALASLAIGYVVFFSLVAVGHILLVGPLERAVAHAAPSVLFIYLPSRALLTLMVRRASVRLPVCRCCWWAEYGRRALALCCVWVGSTVPCIVSYQLCADPALRRMSVVFRAPLGATLLIILCLGPMLVWLGHRGIRLYGADEAEVRVEADPCLLEVLSDEHPEVLLDGARA